MMVRNYQKKTERTSISEEAVKRAIEDVRNGNRSIRAAAEHHGLKKSMLHKRLSRILAEAIDIGILVTVGSSKYSSRNVFSEEEGLLEEYLVKCSKMNYELTYKQVRDFAYSYAIKLKKTCPKSWDEKKTAGIDWMKGFMKRRPRLSLRKPENTSVARNVNFNKHKMDTFYNNFESVLEKYKFPESRIINVDESGVTTVLQSPKVVAPTGEKQVGQCVSAERGELVTFCGIVTASGNSIPLVYVYPRVNLKTHFMHGAPSGSRGFATRNGWMTQTVFLEVAKHIQQNTSATKENPVLIILDNHESHVCLETILFCREYGIILLTFPPHTSHRLQPLDVAIYGPFKNHCKLAFNKWISENPGKSITIYEIAKLTAPAYDEAFSRKNIVAGFKKTGIFPFNRSSFKDEDFLCSIPTDQPMLHRPESEADAEEPPNADQISRPSCSFTPESQAKKYKKLNTGLPTPEEKRPYPKAELREKSRKGRKKGKCCILTDTPEKDRIESEVLERRSKKFKKIACKRKIIKCEKATFKKKQKLVDSSDTEDYLSADLCEEEGMSPLENESEIEDLGVNLEGKNINNLDFLLIKLASKKTVKYYVGQVNEKISPTEFKVSFLKKRSDSYTFVEPDISDLGSVKTEDIVSKLPQPNIVGGTSRAVQVFRFKFNFMKFNMG